MEVTRANGSSPAGTGRGGKESKERREPPAAVEEDGGGERAGAVSLAGLSDDMLTPEVRRVVDTMVGEIERLRREMGLAAGREAYLKELVDTHPFLPVLDRRAFVRELGKVLSHAEHLRTPAGLLCLHVANGEEVRRRHGRQVLDRSLGHFCDILVGEVHPTDILGSLGGNDFAVILLVGDAATATAKGEAITEAVRTRPLRWRKRNIPLEVVTGIRVLEAGVSPEVALAEADRDLMGHG